MAKRAPNQRRPSGAPTTRALEHGDEAAGAEHQKPGFCFTPADDLAFALGFPYLRYLVDDEQDPRATAERLIFHASPEQLRFGREAAARFVRAICQPAIVDSQQADPPLLPATVAALDRGGPVTEPEAREHMLTLFGDEARLPPHAPMAFLIMEALLGPDFVSGVILEGLEGIPVGRWISHGHVQRVVVDLLGIMSLRLRAADRDKLFVRLRELKARILREASHGFDDGAATRALALPEPQPPVRNGFIDRTSPAWATFEQERNQRRQFKAQIEMLQTDANNCGFDIFDGPEVVDLWRPTVRASAEAVREARLRQMEPVGVIPDPRFVFVGGEEVYRVEVEVWSQYKLVAPSDAHPNILDRFGRIRSPLTVELVLDMALRSKAKAQAKAWLFDRADFARPVLSSLATSPSRLAKGAADFLNRLPS